MKEDTPERQRNVAEIILEKQRNGPTGVCELFFDGETTRFGDLAREPSFGGR